MISTAPPVRFLVRFPAALHATLQRAAAKGGMSLNEYCVRRLAACGGALTVHHDAPALAARAADVCGTALVGVVLYGSWARGVAGTGSDVDVLVVVDRSQRLTRALYRTWDEAPVTWEGRSIDPHFIHLPGEEPSAGPWAEAAVDGVVLFETDLRISAALGRVRRDIAAGRLVRRVVHGQPYWVVAA